MAVMSSMKVEASVRERLSALAQCEGSTVSRTLEHLLDEHDRRVRFAAVAAAYAEPSEDYADEVEAWDEIAADGLGDR